MKKHAIKEKEKGKRNSDIRSRKTLKPYTSQEQFTGDWLSFLQMATERVGRCHHRKEVSVAKAKALEKTLWERWRLTIEALQPIPLIELAKKAKLCRSEIKILMLVFMLTHWQDGSPKTAVEILKSLWGNPREAIKKLKYLAEGARLFKHGICRSFRFRGKKEILVSKEVVDLLLGISNEIPDMKQSKESQLLSNTPGLGDEVDPKVTLENVVFSCEQKTTIDLALSQFKGKGCGDLLTLWGLHDKSQMENRMVMLFYGPPGTGKSLTAKAFAGTLGLKVISVNIPEVFSKWWGETEHNIVRAFSQANRTSAVLVLDEADSLVYKRTTDNDRQHYNSHVNVMLTEIEKFNGILIMTTNFADNLDPALERRIDIKIEFHRPEAEERVRIWMELVPARMPLADDIDFERLGTDYELSGGEIHNVIKNAARLAVTRKHEKVQLEDLISSIEMERIKCSEETLRPVGFRSG